MAEKDPGTPPKMGPYLFPVLLLAFGSWFFFDGWISSAPAMQKHLTFNRVGSAILLPWAAFDFWRTWKKEKAAKGEPPQGA